MYEVMSGDTLSWKVPSPKQSGTDSAPEAQFSGDGGPTKILKVCFCTNNNLGKNFTLVKCDNAWQVKVRSSNGDGIDPGPALWKDLSHPSPGHHPHHPGERAAGPGRGSDRLLRPDAEAPEVGGAALAPPGPDGRGGGEALRKPPRGGRVEVSEETLTLPHHTRHGRPFLLCRYDLRIRYIPVNFLEKFREDRSTFLFFYQQVFKRVRLKLLSLASADVCAHLS